MDISKQILMKSGLLPKLKLGIKQGNKIISTGKHKVKIIEEKIVRLPPKEEGDDGYYVRYIFEEDGEKKQYDTRMRVKGGQDPSYFVQAMAEIQPGEELLLEMKKAGVKNYVEITRMTGGETEIIHEDEEKDSIVSGLEDVAKGYPEMDETNDASGV